MRKAKIKKRKKLEHTGYALLNPRALCRITTLLPGKKWLPKFTLIAQSKPFFIGCLQFVVGRVLRLRWNTH